MEVGALVLSCRPKRACGFLILPGIVSHHVEKARLA